MHEFAAQSIASPICSCRKVDAMDALRHSLFLATISFRVLGRALDVVEPCVGMGGYRELATIGNFQYGSSSSRAFDTDARLKPFYDARRNSNGVGPILQSSSGLAATSPQSIWMTSLRVMVCFTGLHASPSTHREIAWERRMEGPLCLKRWLSGSYS